MKKISNFLILSILIQSCSLSKDDSSSGETGEGGSLARFTVAFDHLYVVNETSLHSYSLSDPTNPVKVDDDYLGFGAETLFPYETKLLLGTEAGMYIYDVTIPGNPSKMSYFEHIRSCDPVVAENDYAFVTLNTSNQRCWNGSNELQILDIHDPYQPSLVKIYPMGNPKGLDIHSDTLFVCDNGLKLLDVTQKNAPHELFYLPQIAAEDVIYHSGRLMVIGSDGFYQYSISSNGLTLLSSIPVSR